MCFIGHSEPRDVFKTLSNIYDEASAVNTQFQYLQETEFQ